MSIVDNFKSVLTNKDKISIREKETSTTQNRVSSLSTQVNALSYIRNKRNGSYDNNSIWHLVSSKYNSALFRDYSIKDVVGNEYKFNVKELQDFILTRKQFFVVIYEDKYKCIDVDKLTFVTENEVIIKHNFKKGNVIEKRTLVNDVLSVVYEYDKDVSKFDKKNALPEIEYIKQSENIENKMMIYKFDGIDLLNTVITEIVNYDIVEGTHFDEILLSQTLFFGHRSLGYKKGAGFKLNPRVKMFFLGEGEEANKLVQTVQPQIRQQEFEQRKSEILRLLANKTNIPTSVFGIDGGDKTATETMERASFFAESINEAMYNISSVFEKLVKDFYIFNEEIEITEVDIKEFNKIDPVAKMDILSKRSAFLPVNEIMKEMFPEASDDEIMMHTINYKVDKMIPLNVHEYEIARSNKLLAFDVAGFE